MSNLALEKAGAHIQSCTSFDARHPVRYVIDGDEETFWTTTGSFPQEVIVKLPGTCDVSRIRTLTTNVRHFSVDKCEGGSPTSWDKVYNLELSDTDGRRQVEQTQTHKLTATYLRFRIEDSWDDFATVHQFIVEGEQV